MKRSFLLLAAGCVSAAMLSGHVFAQDTKNPVDVASSQANNKPAPAAFSNSSSANAAGAAMISERAIKDFKGRFANAKDEKWFSQKGGFIVYFTQDGFRDRVYYNKKGRWQYSLKYCDENKLPRDIRAAVKSTYYDLAITVVEIVETPGHLVYLVHMEDATNLKIIRVFPEGEMDVYQEFKKS